MIPNLVTHVRNELTSTFKALFSDSYIISMVLGELEDDVSSSFINKYVDKYDDKGERTYDGVKIPILTNYPEDMEKSGAFILVGMGEGKEDNGNIGMSSGGFVNSASPVIKEKGAHITRINSTTIAVDIQNEPEISSVVIPNLTVRDITYKEGKLYINNLSRDFLDAIDYGVDTLQVNYSKLEQNGQAGMGYGFVVDETASILIVSQNLDDIRAIDAIVKAAIILMRRKEFNVYSLGSLSVAAPVPLEDYAPGSPNITFGREIDLEYRVDYHLNSENTKRIDNILLTLGKTNFKLK